MSPSALRAAPQGALTPFTWLMGTSAVVSFGAWFPDAANPAAPQATLAVQHIPAGAWFVDCELIDPPGATAFTVQVGDPSGAVTESIPAPAGHLVFGAVFKAADGSVRVYRAAGWSWKSCTFEPND